MKRLQELRKTHKLSQEELASILGVARTTLAGYENAGMEPDFNTLIKIVDHFNVSIDYLLMRDFQQSELNSLINQLSEDKIEVIKSLVILLMERK